MLPPMSARLTRAGLTGLPGLLALLASSCGGFTPRSDQGVASDHHAEPRADLGGAKGPGPHGSLPTGYCCSSNADCRQRRCAELGGVKMCQDECETDAACQGRLAGFTCRKTDGSLSLCAPTGAPSCAPAESFPRGPRPGGACCQPHYTGLTGEECDGNHCISVGDLSNPWVCSNACASSADCPIGYECHWASYYRICFPTAKTYTCAP